MKEIKVLSLIGGITKNSLNRRLYDEIVKHNTTGLQFETFDLASIPFYSQDIENNPPANVVEFKARVAAADAIFIITPEYNRSFPGVLKNAIDWGSRPFGFSLWSGKPTAITGASVGRIGTFGAQQHLKNVCAFLDMRVMNQPEFYFDASTSMDDNGLLPTSIVFIQTYLKKFEEFVAKGYNG